LPLRTTTENLKEGFPDTLPSQRLESSNIPLANNLKPEWMAGFCTGESNFFITVQKSKTKSGCRFSAPHH
jgi:hypothetical protein